MSGPSAKVRLLLVEDVAQVSQYIRNLLNAQPHVQLLDVLSDGRTALEQIRAHRPDVLMIDALLQGRVSGLHLLEQLRHAGFDLPVIVITVPQRPIKVEASWGIVRVLSMPFSGFDLINGIQAATQESVGAIKEISGTIEKLSEISSTIAAAVEEQGAATQEISRNVQQAAQGTQQVSSNIMDVQRGASETGSASSQVLSAAQSLSGDSNRLKLEVGKFLDTVRAA